MLGKERIGIIDIGSNSIRLVIYEHTEEQAYRVIDEAKESARLSERIGHDGILPPEHIQSIVDTLLHFTMLCTANKVNRIRAVATAAIRNAANCSFIIEALFAKTGLAIDVLSGEEEARAGFIGMINTLDINDGILVDIGGGSTEVSLFRNRSLLHSVSFPFGSVNTSKHYGNNGNFTDFDIAEIKQMVEDALQSHSWMRENRGLPLVGLGGTIRSLSKISQRAHKYSLPLTHNYSIPHEEMNRIIEHLSHSSLEQRETLDGLSKDRADIIVPGITILHTIFMHTEASHYVISGSGLRDGLFFETLHPHNPIVPDVVQHSVHNLLALHPAVPLQHVEQVKRIAVTMFDGLQTIIGLPAKSRLYLEISALLYRIGVTVNYYDYRMHTFYLIAHSRINGLSHKEIVLCALIASYKSKKRTRQQILMHKDLLDESDLQIAVQLGTLLDVAIALDRSETQPIQQLAVQMTHKELHIHCTYRHPAAIEQRQLQSVTKDFKKTWGLQIRLVEETTSK